MLDLSLSLSHCQANTYSYLAALLTIKFLTLDQQSIIYETLFLTLIELASDLADVGMLILDSTVKHSLQNSCENQTDDDDDDHEMVVVAAQSYCLFPHHHLKQLLVVVAVVVASCSFAGDAAAAELSHSHLSAFKISLLRLLYWIIDLIDVVIN